MLTRNYDSTNPNSEEVEELKKLFYELEAENIKLSKKHNHLQYKRNLQLVNDNNELQVEESDDSASSAKRQMKKNPFGEEEKEMALVRILLKTFPDFELNEKEIFTSQANNNTCIALVPELQKLMNVHNYNPSSEQVKAWLKSIHETKRKAYLKSNPSNRQQNPSNQSPIDEDSQAEKNSNERKPSKSKNEEGLRIEDGAKFLMKRLIDKTYTQNEYELKSDQTFKSKVNTDICEKLIPKLMEDIKPTYNLSYKQVESWLRSIHNSKRKAYLKLNQISLDDKVDNEQESVQTVGQQINLKGKEPNDFSEDEDELKIEDEAKALMRTLLKTFPSELNLKVEETFGSKANSDICQKLIPRLQNEMKAFNPTYEQAETWLQSIHKSKRYAYLKSNQLIQPNPISIDY
ncbi:hypothetical protein GLOIN_2v1667513 [Rhizophagus clarus]|uniref:Uncharacterized protein n=1 Tax=Rhizophagus clarus TaxID=94130 RepID=A0A8H3QCZ5_9GLOM|nr:hypothetical protein GLOIN_2v1667513 [Rhizophagus clarus]